MVTKKGKVYKFDDIHCLLGFTKSREIKEGEAKDIYLVDFSGSHSLFKANEGFLLQSNEVHAPMNGNVIAFKDKDSMKGNAERLGATELNWQELQK